MTIYEMEKQIKVPCEHCGDDLWSEIIDESSHEDAHRRWSIHLDVHCHCGAVNIFHTVWTPYTIELWDVELPEMDDPREEALTVGERNPLLR